MQDNAPVWSAKATLDVAASGRFSSDRTITESAEEIWKAISILE
jgi:glucan phosphorylase